MSRCFPFPPPGYEKKIRVDETDLLTKEKQREKKHKKDKKDKKKKEGKEKKGKERIKDKLTEKKEKKEKHKDGKDKGRDKEENRTVEEKKAEALPDGKGGGKVGTNILLNNDNGDSRYALDLARRIRDEEKATRSHVQNIKLPDQRIDGVPGRMVKNNSCYPFQETNHKREGDKKVVGAPRNFLVGKISSSAIAREFFGTDQKEVEGSAKTVEKKDVWKQMEGKEKTLKKSETNGDKTKDKDREKKSELKVKDGDKEKKREERAKEISRHGGEQPKFLGGEPRLKERNKDFHDTRNSKPPDLSRASNENLASKGYIGKRREIGADGFLYENRNRPNKVQKSVSSPLSVVENGRKFSSLETPSISASELQGAANNCKPEAKEHRTNGFIEANLQPSSLPSIMQVNKNGEAPEKPPHPDSKYLSQMLLIPKRDLLEFDDQEWLLGSKEIKPKKPKADFDGSDETPQVWDQALVMEFADISALPYVIPY